jgi:uncharacterized membrane protein YczE
MKRYIWLLIVVLGNGLGSALMFQTHLGMSAWGAAASNVSLFFGITPGTAFVFVSIVFYLLAILLTGPVRLFDAGLSMLFLMTFSLLLDGFITLIPDLSSSTIMVRLGWNIVGMLILLASISLHLKINLCVHPMDVYLRSVQIRVKSVTFGTYLAYASAFLVAIVFGLLAGTIRDIGIGTALLLLFGGVIMGGYDRYLLSSWEGSSHVSD